MQGQVHDTDRLFEDPIKFVNFEFKMSGIVFAGRELKYVTQYMYLRIVSEQYLFISFNDTHFFLECFVIDFGNELQMCVVTFK